MAKTRTCLGRVEIGASPTVIGEVRSINIDEQAAVEEGAAMGSCDAQPDAGLITSTGQIECWFDSADAGQIIAIGIGTKQDLAYQPDGAGTGLSQEKILDALITGVAINGDMGNVSVGRTFAFTGGSVDRTAQT